MNKFCAVAIFTFSSMVSSCAVAPTASLPEAVIVTDVESRTENLPEMINSLLERGIPCAKILVGPGEITVGFGVVTEHVPINDGDSIHVFFCADTMVSDIFAKRDNGIWRRESQSNGKNEYVQIFATDNSKLSWLATMNEHLSQDGSIHCFFQIVSNAAPEKIPEFLTEGVQLGW